MTGPSRTWSVIRFLRTQNLPRFTVFRGETWTTSRSVADEFEAGDGLLLHGTDYEIVYQGPRDGCRHHEVHWTPESRAHYYGMPPEEL